MTISFPSLLYLSVVNYSNNQKENYILTDTIVSEASRGRIMIYFKMLDNSSQSCKTKRKLDLIIIQKADFWRKQRTEINYPRQKRNKRLGDSVLVLAWMTPCLQEGMCSISLLIHKIPLVLFHLQWAKRSNLPSHRNIKYPHRLLSDKLLSVQSTRSQAWNGRTMDSGLALLHISPLTLGLALPPLEPSFTTSEDVEVGSEDF